MEKSVLRNEDIAFINEFKRKFKDAYNINPKKTLKLMKMCARELGYYDSDEVSSVSEFFIFFSKETNRMWIYSGILILLGICALEYFYLYYFGLAFFCAGVLLNLGGEKPKETIIFLFTHGLTGGLIMFWGLFSNVSNYLNDYQVYRVMALTSIVCCVSAFLRTILLTLSNNKTIRRSNTYLLFVIGYFIMGLLNLFVFFGVRF